MKAHHTNSAHEKAAGYSLQISQYFETGRIGHYKPEISFEMLGPYQTGFEHRCIVQHKMNFYTMSVPEAKALWLQIGRSLGVNDWKLGHLLRSVPDDKRAID